MRSPLSQGAADLFHPIIQRRGGDVDNRRNICQTERGVTNKKKERIFFFFFFSFALSLSWNLIQSCESILFLFFLYTFIPVAISSLSLSPLFTASLLRWWALLPCSTTAFSHSESLIKPPHPRCLIYSAKGKGHLFVTKCLSYSFTWQQSSLSFPTVKCQIWKPSIRLMFGVRLHTTFNPGSILQSNKSLSHLGDERAFWHLCGLRNISTLCSAAPLMYRSTSSLYSLY